MKTDLARLARGCAAIAFAGLAVLVLMAVLTPADRAETAAPADTPVFINEIHYDDSNSTGDINEGVEVAGPAGTDLTGWALVPYNGNGGAQYSPLPLSGVLPNQQNGFGTLWFDIPGLQNGSPDGVALVAPGPVVVQFLSYEGFFIAIDGPAAGMASTDIGVAESNSTPVDYALQLTGTGFAYEDFGWTGPSPQTRGLVNTGQSFSAPTAALTITKTAESSSNVTFHGTVTYTVLLSNSGAISDTGVLLTDTLPAEVDFGQWLEQPADAVELNDEITWSGTVTAGHVITFSFVVNHVGDYGDLVTNTAIFSGTTSAGTAEAAFAVQQPYTATILINEADSDNLSTDTQEFIELFDGGTGNTPLDGLVVILFNGSDNLSYLPVFDLDGYSTDGDGYFVIGSVPEADLYVDPLVTPSWLQNGADAIALYVGNEVDFPNDTAITLSNLIDAIVYDTDDPDDPELLVLLNSGQPQIDENGRGNMIYHSNQRCPNGAGGQRNTASYYQNTPTPGAANDCPPQYDAAIAKSGPLLLVPGNDVTYTLLYTSTGIQGITGVVITDVLPAGATYITDTGGLTPISTSPVVWNVGNLPAGSQASFDVRVHIPDEATGFLTNTAIIAADLDEVPGNNVATYAATTVAYDLEVTKSVDAAEVFIEDGVGQLVTYTIQVFNHSPLTDTTRLTVTDVLPGDFVYVSDDFGLMHSGIGSGDDPLIWVFSNLVHDTSITFHVVVSVTDEITSSGLRLNEVAIAGSPADVETGNNEARDDGVMVWRLISMAAARALPDDAYAYVKGYVNFPPGLLHDITRTYDEFMFQDAALGTVGLDVYFTGSLTKFDGFGVGEEVRVWGTMDEYNGKREIVVTDPGHAVATGEAISLIPWSRQTGQINETTEGVLVQVSGVVTYATSSYLDINDNSGVTRIYRDFDTGVSLAEFAVGERVQVLGVGTQYDSSFPYDSGYQVGLRFQSDIDEYPRVLAVGPADGAVGVAVNSFITATFNLTMTNVGELTFLLRDSAGPVPGGVSFDSGTRTATFATEWLAHGTTYTATLTADLAATNGLTLTEDYTWSFTTELSQPSLSATKTVETPHDPVHLGDLITYTITIRNDGQLDAVGVVVTDVLPAGLTGVDLHWTGVVTAGMQVQFTIPAVVTTTLDFAGETITNSVYFDHSTGNGSATAQFTIREPFRIFLPVVLRSYP